MHDCPKCGMACACDLEDHWQDAPDDCSCQCEESADLEYEEYGDYDPPYYDEAHYPTDELGRMIPE